MRSFARGVVAVARGARARWAMTWDRGVIVLTRMLTWKMRRETDATATRAATTRRMGRLNRSVKEF